MNTADDDRLGAQLRRAVPPLADRDARLGRDLWPEMRRRLARPEVRPRGLWLDWTLAAAATIAFILTPEVIPALLYLL
jgi:hypothetical protein